MIVRARTVITMAAGVIENGAVVIDGNRIVAVGPYDEVRAAHGGEAEDIGERALLPGLINAHCHLDYTCLRNAIPRQPSFTDWIREINARKRALEPVDYLRSIEAGFAEAKRFGTTSIVNYESFPNLIGEIRDPLRTWWCAELIDVGTNTEPRKTICDAWDRLAEARSPLASGALAPHALYTASPDLFRACAALSADVLCTTHLAESGDETQMFRFGSGPLHDFLAGLGRDNSDCGRDTPFARAAKLCRPMARWLFAHANELSDDDVARIEALDGFNVAHCPRSHAYFQHAPFAYERLRDAGANICIATDSLASAPDLSLLGELRSFRSKRPHVSAIEALEMVTVNPARALACDAKLGRIAPGYLADIIAVPFDGPRADAAEAVVGFEGEIDWFLLNGGQ